MRPQTIGRVLGIGVRLAGQRVAASVEAAASAPRQAPADASAQTRAAAQAAGQASRGVARGVGGFLRPFRRVGGKIWLEVTGVFFLLPVVVFVPRLWEYWARYAGGSDRRTFPLALVVVVVFLYLGVSSFWRAHRE